MVSVDIEPLADIRSLKKSTVLHLILSSVTLETNSVIPSPLVNVVDYGWCNNVGFTSIHLTFS